ncbi:alcohol dehydrogenase catalytic domain-containing protein [Salinispora arenicola]|uniref:alcohol dehydrogenase catalytic domain-containing protein n=1 Tax=Salinispora arenicola TaxID=168697 RepID=UPI0027DDCE65|nr:alcohol dehydrogenase catalytic domain-containing protein [Salinispora arenicola]
MYGRVGKRNFPLVPGHEITGVVAAVGPEVTKHQVRDLVSVGCMVNSCRRCASCRAGAEQYCAGGAPVKRRRLSVPARDRWHNGDERRPSGGADVA